MADSQQSGSQPNHLRRKLLLKFFLPLLIIAFLLLGFGYRFYLSTSPQPTLCQANLLLIDDAISRWATTTAPPNLGNPGDQMISQYLPNGIHPAVN